MCRIHPTASGRSRAFVATFKHLQTPLAEPDRSLESFVFRGLVVLGVFVPGALSGLEGVGIAKRSNRCCYRLQNPGSGGSALAQKAPC